MLRTTLALVLVACSGTASSTPTEPSARAQEKQPATATFDHTHARWTALLGRHVQGDRFDYAALAKDTAPLDAYLEQLQAVRPAELAGWTREQAYAFWINVYNAYTIKKVVDAWPLESIRDLDGLLGLKSVFAAEWIPLAALNPDGDDEPLSLDDVEHRILRPRYEDARVHAAVNCASVGCPPLRAEAFVAERLDEQLDAQMRAFVADRQRNELDRDAGVARVSKLFDWFASDFERDAGSVRAYLVRFAPEADRSFLGEARLRYAEYDWDVNAVPVEDER